MDLALIGRALAGLIVRKPSALALAERKRQLERELRAQGHSRAEAVALVSERFRNRGKDA